MGDDCDESSSMPWSAYNRYFEFIKDLEESFNFEAKCKLCNNTFRCSYKTASNLKTHLKALNALNVQPVQPNSRKRNHEEKHKNVDGQDFFKKKLTQADVDRVTNNLIISHTLPHSLVESPEFREAVLLGCPSNLTVCNRKTFRKRLDTLREKMHSNVEAALQRAKYVATTADGWSKFGRGFLGMTAHWIDSDTMERESAALCLKRLKKRHTHDRLAAAVSQATECFKFPPEKITRCTTDSASNFKKAFKVYSYTISEDLAAKAQNQNQDQDTAIAEEDERLDAQHSDSDAEGDVGDQEQDPLDVDQALTAAKLKGVVLPPHQRCAAHITSLLATRDAKDALDVNANFRRLYDSTGEKLKSYVRLQGRSDLVAGAFKDNFGVKLKRAGDTRWNSEYDYKEQIVSLHSADEEKFNSTLETANLQKLTKVEVRFLQEYVYVMYPVAFALDVLQREKNMYAGYLIPTVLSMERCLKERRVFSDQKPLKHCDILVRTLLEAIRKPQRFGEYLENGDLQLAAILLPQFKMTWVPTHDKDRLQRELIAAAAALPLEINTAFLGPPL
ncbi:hypothetical protein ONE63_010324 [Megalurothrips usitatus]|uniref:BED-type domain-containing protein n=1 Tax=Megalurothrips usitatus TaxID=439358 RepID=A0AAV7XLL4_9NEOP|nr:hypothetical protein ONE63_010324 [Megalurothrips usitatus]